MDVWRRSLSWTGGQAVHIWQESPSGNWSASAFFNRTGWKDLTVGRNADGRLELFAIGPDDWAYHLWQVAPNNGWSDWAHIGGVVSGKQLTVISNPDGRLELFILVGGDAWHVWQTPFTGDSCQPYVDALNTARQRLTAVLNDPDHTAADFKLAEQAVTNAENGLNQCRANPPLAVWSNPASFGAHDLRYIEVSSNADERLELFALGGNFSIYHIWMTAVNNGWISQWSPFNVVARQFVVAQNEKGRLVVAYLGADGIVYLLAQVDPNGDWTTPLPGSLIDPEPKPTVSLNGDPKKIKKGELTTLKWTSSGADSLDLDHGIGSVKGPNGSRSVWPPDIGITTYTITARSRGGTAHDTQQITVEEGPGEAVYRVVLELQPGALQYLGTMLPIPGGVLKYMTNANPAFEPNNGMYLVKVGEGHSTSECGNSNAVIPLAQGQSTKDDKDMVALFGSTDMSHGVSIVACPANISLQPMFVNVTYWHP